MAFRIICGVPRAGKTYYAVDHIRNRYFTRELTLKPEFEGLQIVTNIDGLKLPHVPLIDWLSYYNNDVTKLFSYEVQEKIFQKYPKVLYIIDEAQMFFPTDFKNKSVGNWLQFHGHWGQDIYFLTQDLFLITRSFHGLAEEIIKALPRTTSVFSSRVLYYNMINVKGEMSSKFTRVKNPEIFSLYRSQSAMEIEKTKNPMTRLLLIAFLFAFIVGGYSIFKMVGLFGSKSQNNLPKKEISKPVSVPPVPSSTVHPVTSFVTQFIASQPSNNLLVAPSVTWVTLNYIKSSDKFLIMFQDKIFTTDTFPYPLTWTGRTLSALIPDTDLQGLGLSPLEQPPLSTEKPASIGRAQTGLRPPSLPNPFTAPKDHNGPATGTNGPASLSMGS